MFQRLGEGTDVVTKEMYDFEDKGGRHVALRPEGTASVVRAFVEHRPATPWKVWYATPGFRYERPQAGRLPPAPPGRRRGASASADPDVDVEVIALGARLPAGARAAAAGAGRSTPWARRPTAPPTPTRCRPGCASRPATSRPSDAEKVDGHPLRVLDSKRAEHAGRRWPTPPRWPTRLDAASVAHVERVQAGLRGARHRRSSSTRRLVRGLDYYTHTAFEFQSDAPRQRAVDAPRRRPLRRPRRAARRPAHARHRLRLRHRAGAAHLRRRGRVPAPPDAPSTSSSSTSTDGAVAARRSPTSSAAPGSAPTAPSTAGRMKSQMKAADRSAAPASPLIVGEQRARPTAPSTVARPRARRADHAGRRPSPTLVDHVAEGRIEDRT